MRTVEIGNRKALIGWPELGGRRSAAIVTEDHALRRDLAPLNLGAEPPPPWINPVGAAP